MRVNMILSLILLLLHFRMIPVLGQYANATANSTSTYMNPILDDVSADP